jgi:heptose III glucuronosyltransferase
MSSDLSPSNAAPDSAPAPALSIIVPCHNAAGYLATCLNSVLAQTMRDFEIIVVDDGSTDDTAQLLRIYAFMHACIRVITQRNGGVSQARNAGLEAARGEYVAFVDADDVVHPAMYEQLLQRSRDGQLDVTVCNAWSVGMDGSWRLVFPDARRLDCCSGADWMARAVADGAMRHYIWCHLYRRSFLENHRLRFLPGITHQDIVWTNEVMLAASRVALHNRPLYFYCQRAGSLSKPKSAAGRLAAARHYLRVAMHLDRQVARIRHHPRARAALRRQVVDEGVGVFHIARRLPYELRTVLYCELARAEFAALLFRNAVDPRQWWRAWRRSLRYQGHVLRAGVMALFAPRGIVDLPRADVPHEGAGD